MAQKLEALRKETFEQLSKYWLQTWEKIHEPSCVINTTIYIHAKSCMALNNKFVMAAAKILGDIEKKENQKEFVQLKMEISALKSGMKEDAWKKEIQDLKMTLESLKHHNEEKIEENKKELIEQLKEEIRIKNLEEQRALIEQLKEEIRNLHSYLAVSLENSKTLGALVEDGNRRVVEKEERIKEWEEWSEETIETLERKEQEFEGMVARYERESKEELNKELTRMKNEMVFKDAQLEDWRIILESVEEKHEQEMMTLQTRMNNSYSCRDNQREIEMAVERAEWGQKELELIKGIEEKNKKVEKLKKDLEKKIEIEEALRNEEGYFKKKLQKMRMEHEAFRNWLEKLEPELKESPEDQNQLNEDREEEEFNEEPLNQVFNTVWDFSSCFADVGSIKELSMNSEDSSFDQLDDQDD
uniref:Trichohyalin-like n=2 Tax=Caenorhabditis tropicalis TaxID=1561998 RepID=A0A1I7UH24_9PELO